MLIFAFGQVAIRTKCNMPQKRWEHTISFDFGAYRSITILPSIEVACCVAQVMSSSDFYRQRRGSSFPKLAGPSAFRAFPSAPWRSRGVFELEECLQTQYLYLRCTETPCIARLRPSFRRRQASAGHHTAVTYSRPLLPPFSSTLTITAAATSSSITCQPSLNVGGAISTPPSQHSTALRRLSALLALGNTLISDRS